MNRLSIVQTWRRNIEAGGKIKEIEIHKLVTVYTKVKNKKRPKVTCTARRLKTYLSISEATLSLDLGDDHEFAHVYL